MLFRYASSVCDLSFAERKKETNINQCRNNFYQNYFQKILKKDFLFGFILHLNINEQYLA